MREASGGEPGAIPAVAPSLVRTDLVQDEREGRMLLRIIG